MNRLLLILLLLATLSSCQSVPAERKNHCACLWEGAIGLPEGTSV
ncbi:MULTISPECIES: lipoprotein [Rhizobium]|nr:lipoprotein [Rhizobium binae]MBX4967726.1 lipoprotein [Rhizobium binae]MBX5242782.1 lipoprotein [Rhizobium sp. NLR22b]